jgi:hypothetical protein|tara:strand:- start:1458 stop:2069 length:612 start_codon:yes stop_codon:yes gene_type:complete
MIIGICGLIGCGKGTVADILVEEHNFKKLSFADKLKDGVATVFGWDRSMLEGDTRQSREWREQRDEFWSKETKRNITPRIVLQEFGTDCMRHGFDDSIWVSIVKQELIKNPTKDFVIPDVRFPNEALMIQKLNGHVWRAIRGPDPVWFRMYQDIGVEPKDVHESEWRWANVNFDAQVSNNGTLDDLKNQVQDHLVSTLPLVSA